MKSLFKKNPQLSNQTQYSITDLEPGAGRLNGLRWLIHAKKSMFRSISVCVISLGSVRQSISLVVNRQRLIDDTEQQSALDSHDGWNKAALHRMTDSEGVGGGQLDGRSQDQSISFGLKNGSA